jgi:hypothetical protein
MPRKRRQKIVVSNGIFIEKNKGKSKFGFNSD